MRSTSTREDLFLVEALHLLTRHVTFVLTEEGSALEATWLALADRHLAIRAEIVERRREEEQLKRQLRALGGAAVPLPEHDDLPMTDGDRPRKSRGMYEHLFDGASLTRGRPRPVVGGAGRRRPSRRAARLGPGVGRGRPPAGADATASRWRSASARPTRSTRNADESVKAAQADARSRLMGLEGRYSTLRRRLFELRHNNRILRWRITALEVEAVGMRSRLDQFLVDRDRLEQAIAERVAAGAVPKTDRADRQRRASGAAAWGAFRPLAT